MSTTHETQECDSKENETGVTTPTPAVTTILHEGKRKADQSSVVACETRKRAKSVPETQGDQYDVKQLATSSILSGWAPSPEAIMWSDDALRKDVENRPRPIRHLPKIIGIASSQRVASVLSPPMQSLFTIDEVKRLPTRGHLLGWARIIDCKTRREAVDAKWTWADPPLADTTATGGGYCWKIDRVWKLQTPVPFKGGQGFRKLSSTQQNALSGATVTPLFNNSTVNVDKTTRNPNTTFLLRVCLLRLGD